MDTRIINRAREERIWLKIAAGTNVQAAL